MYITHKQKVLFVEFMIMKNASKYEVKGTKFQLYEVKLSERIILRKNKYQYYLIGASREEEMALAEVAKLVATLGVNTLALGFAENVKFIMKKQPDISVAKRSILAVKP